MSNKIQHTIIKKSKPFDVNAWYKAALDLQKAVKKERKKYIESINYEHFENNGSGLSFN